MKQLGLQDRNIGLSLIHHIWDRHRVWLVTAFILSVLFILVPDQGATSAAFTIDALIRTAPFLVLSIAIAAYAGASGADNLIGRAFTGSPLMMIAFAAALGGLSPFCSCGVIPLIAALLAMGVPLSGVMAFWLASPVIDPSMFVLTSGLLGLEFAVAKTFAAIGLGLFGGYVTFALMRLGYFADPLRPDVGGGGCGASAARTRGVVVWRFWQEQVRREKFGREARVTALFLLKWLTFAFLLESLMLAYVPGDWIASTLGGDGFLPIITATFVGVPAYLNGYAALPLVSGLIEQGMEPGAGLAFLVAGGGHLTSRRNCGIRLGQTPGIRPIHHPRAIGLDGEWPGVSDLVGVIPAHPTKGANWRNHFPRLHPSATHSS